MNSSFKVILNPEVAAFTEHLSKLPEADLKYVIFMCDFNDSPFWQLPDEVGDRKAMAKAYENGEKPLPRPLIEAAMEEYRTLVWDEEQEQSADTDHDQATFEPIRPVFGTCLR